MKTSPRQSKIIATLGPATDSPEMIHQLVQSGVNIFRINMSHAQPDWVRRVTKAIRNASESLKTWTGLLIDTQGPAIRTGALNEPFHLQPGDDFTFVIEGAPAAEGKWTRVNYTRFPEDVHPGDLLLIDNGILKMSIEHTSHDRVNCKVLNDGTLGSKRHINLPGVNVSLPALTEKDLSDVQLGLELDADFIALSFVRSPDDIVLLREQFRARANPPQIIAKIEHQMGVNNAEAIANEADALMIARGDLGVECPYQDLPIIQRRLVKLCLRIGKPVIVATQILESMVENPMPTRAEITDVANAVFEQADALMLSGETTVGKHPLECVEVMDNISRRIERSGGANFHQAAELTSARQKLARRAVQLADDLPAAAVIVFTGRGLLARTVAAMRPRSAPIFAFTASTKVARQLTLCRGVVPQLIDKDPTQTAVPVDQAMEGLVNQGRLKRGDSVILLTTVTSHDQSVDGLKILRVK